MKRPTKYRPLAGSERTRAEDSKPAGPAAAEELVTVRLIVRRPAGRPEPRLEDFERTPASKRKSLSRAEFAAVHGAAAQDLNSVAAFARAQKLEVTEANAARRSVVVRGTVAQMNKAFAIELEYYDAPEGRYRSYEGPVSLPASLVPIVVAVVGLDNRPLPARHAAADPTNTFALTPQVIAELYDFPDGGGCGQTIGIFEMKITSLLSSSTPGYAMSDVVLTMGAFGSGVVPKLIDVSVDGQTNTGVTDPETILDLTVAGAIAPAATIAVYFTGDTILSVIDALEKMIHPDAGDPVPTVLSISYGWFPDDTAIAAMEIQEMQQLFQDAALLGITVLAASGDTGVKYSQFSFEAQISYPASDPFVLACGGTTVGNVIGPTFEEYVWNDTFPGPGGTTVPLATGGGVSGRFPVPLYQNSASVPLRIGTGLPGRGIPDVAGNASVNSGYPLVVNGTSGTEGGTSAVAPLYAGLIARINSMVGFSAGFINPLLYSAGDTICRDVTGAAGPTNNSFGGLDGYPAGPGWDACTGLGSIKGKALLLALLQAEGAPEIIDPANPFKFANWNIPVDEGANDNGDSICFGNWNHGDAGDAQGQSYPTIIENSASTAAALIGRNTFTGDGTVGVFGSSSGATRSIGVAGESGCGCGVYGIGTFGTSIGVAGRSMGSAAVEDIALEQVVGEPVGVLGHSTNGAGVRGHSGPLLPLDPNASPLASLIAAPGGVFSSGQLQETAIAESALSQKLSLSALPQLRLVPSINSKLPLRGRLGDLYVNVTGDTTAADGTLTVTIYLCVVAGDGSLGNAAMWAPFQLGAAQVGG